VPATGDERVVGVAEFLLQERRPVLGTIDDRLGVLDAKAHLKRLWFQGHSAGEKHGVRVAGAVTDREDRHVARDIAAARHQPDEPAVAQVDVLDLAAKTNFAAERLDPLPQRLDDGRQAVAAEMWAVLVQDRRLALALREEFQDALHVRSGTAGSQFAIAERAGAAFAEQVVALRVERAAGIERLNVADAVANGRSAFEHQRGIPAFGEEIRRRQPARAGTDYNWPMKQRPLARFGQCEWRFVVHFDDRRAVTARVSDNARFVVGQPDFGVEDEMDVVFVARVQALAEDPPIQAVQRNVEQAGQPLRQRGVRLVESDTEVGDADGHWPGQLPKNRGREPVGEPHPRADARGSWSPIGRSSFYDRAT
jgi:hypothetical protein